MNNRPSGLFPERTIPHWLCPCGSEPVGRGYGTFVSLREPACPFCGRKFKQEYERAGDDRQEGARQ
jgi:hypothetical protein